MKSSFAKPPEETTLRIFEVLEPTRANLRELSHAADTTTGTKRAAPRYKTGLTKDVHFITV